MLLPRPVLNLITQSHGRAVACFDFICSTICATINTDFDFEHNHPEVRKGCWGVNFEEQKIVAITKENSLHAYLATCDGDQPVVRPASPIVEEDMSIWVTTLAPSRKVKLKSNPKICLAFVEQPRGDKAAVVFGEAQVIPDPQAKKRVWELAGFDLSRHFPEGSESKNSAYSESFRRKSNGETAGKAEQKSTGKLNNEEVYAVARLNKSLIMPFRQ